MPRSCSRACSQPSQRPLSQEVLHRRDRLAVVGHVHPGQRLRRTLGQWLHEGAVLAEERGPVPCPLGDDVANRPAHDGVPPRVGFDERPLPTRASRGSGPRSPPRAALPRRRCPPHGARGSSAARRTRAASRRASLPAVVGASPRPWSRRRSPPRPARARQGVKALPDIRKAVHRGDDDGEHRLAHRPRRLSRCPAASPAAQAMS